MSALLLRSLPRGRVLSYPFLFLPKQGLVPRADESCQPSVEVQVISQVDEEKGGPDQGEVDEDIQPNGHFSTIPTFLEFAMFGSRSCGTVSTLINNSGGEGDSFRAKDSRLLRAKNVSEEEAAN